MKAGRSEGPKNQETDQLEELWQSGARSFPKQSRSEPRAHFRDRSAPGRVKQWTCLKETERWEARARTARSGAEVLNKVTIGGSASGSALAGHSGLTPTAGLNHQMRKTACPVVWGGSPSTIVVTRPDLY